MSSNRQERSASSSRQPHFGKLATAEAGRRRVRFDLASLLGLPRSYGRSASLRSLRGAHERDVAINSSTSRADKMTICAPKTRYRKVKSDFEATIARQTEDLQRQRRNIALCRRRRLMEREEDQSRKGNEVIRPSITSRQSDFDKIAIADHSVGSASNWSYRKPQRRNGINVNGVDQPVRLLYDFSQVVTLTLIETGITAPKAES